MPPPMTISRRCSLRPFGPAGVVLAAAVAVAACSAGDATPLPSPSPTAEPTVSPTPDPTPTPSPSPVPTPRFTNEPDRELAELIPAQAAGADVVVAPFDEFALTPGDVAVAFGEIGNRFSSLVLAYVEAPRTTLYAMRVDGPEVATEDLEPHLATAGRYVGIAGLDPDPWESDVVDGTRVWVRPEDNATAAGTHIYTWSSGDVVFLLIGVDERVNRAIIGRLPGEPARTPGPDPSGSPTPSAEPSSSAEG
jgi:hypothetical protein